MGTSIWLPAFNRKPSFVQQLSPQQVQLSMKSHVQSDLFLMQGIHRGQKLRVNVQRKKACKVTPVSIKECKKCGEKASLLSNRRDDLV